MRRFPSLAPFVSGLQLLHEAHAACLADYSVLCVLDALYRAGVETPIVLSSADSRDERLLTVGYGNVAKPA